MQINEAEFLSRIIDNKESILDGSCKYWLRTNYRPREIIKAAGLIRSIGLTGKTRIVIEYDHDTGEGYIRIVSEDPATMSTLGCMTVHHKDGCPMDCRSCDEYKHYQQRFLHQDTDQSHNHLYTENNGPYTRQS